MTTYPCWHESVYGYCFRHPTSGWWFVPDEGQSQSNVDRHLHLTDLVFVCPFDWQLERQHEMGRRGTRWWRRVSTVNTD